jgi:hypothetical protein
VSRSLLKFLSHSVASFNYRQGDQDKKDEVGGVEDIKEMSLLGRHAQMGRYY